jgi:hypothetical protein
MRELGQLPPPAPTMGKALEQLAAACDDFLEAFDPICDDPERSAAARTPAFDTALLYAGVLHGAAMLVHERSYDGTTS